MTKEALKSAIEFAEYCLEELDLSHMASNQAKRLVQKSKEALSSPNGEAQPEQEKERCVGCEACIDTACGRDECPKGWPKALQPEQEPVAWMSPSWIDPYTRGWQSDSFESIPIEGWLPLYTTPPQRTWVGLTTDDWDEIRKQVKYNFEMTTGEYAERVSHLVEDKLREKNT